MSTPKKKRQVTSKAQRPKARQAGTKKTPGAKNRKAKSAPRKPGAPSPPSVRVASVNKFVRTVAAELEAEGLESMRVKSFTLSPSTLRSPSTARGPAVSIQGVVGSIGPSRTQHAKARRAANRVLAEPLLKDYDFHSLVLTPARAGLLGCNCKPGQTPRWVTTVDPSGNLTTKCICE